VIKLKNSYREILPSEKLQDVIHSFWVHENLTSEPEVLTIFPDSYFKIIFYVQDGQVVSYFMTGLWSDQKVVSIPPNGKSYGCRLNILAPEYLLGHEIKSIFQSRRQLDISYLNLRSYDLSSFEKIVEQWEKELLRIRPSKAISPNKLRLSQLLYKTNGLLSASEVSDQIFWTNRQINRYLNQYLGVSLKRYLNIQKAYFAYLQIREGKLSPQNEGYFDQAHFIREIKKHTGFTPSALYQGQNDRFIQLKNIRRR